MRATERSGLLVVTGGPGCLRGDTPIHDPVDGTTKTVRERFDEGTGFHVLSLDTSTGHAQPAVAEAPQMFPEARMLRFTFSDGQTMVVTPGHRFWDGERWVKASDVAERISGRLRGSLPVLLPSSSGSGR